MDNLRECAIYYDSLIGNEYTLVLENDIKLVFKFEKSNFFHLLGLHKLTDVNEFYIGNRIKSKNVIYKEILSGVIPDSILCDKKGYDNIAERINNFQYIKDLLTYDKSNKVIIDFDKRLINRFESLLEGTKYILYKNIGNLYVHLTLGQKSNIYPETFFAHNGKDYISEQTLLDIIDIQVKKHKNWSLDYLFQK